MRKDGASAASISSRSQVELVGTDPDEARVEDEVRVGPRREQRDQGGLALDRGGVDLELGEARPADLVLLDRHLPPPGALVELHEEDLAGPILVERDRLGRAGVGVRDRAGRPTWVECQWPSAR